MLMIGCVGVFVSSLPPSDAPPSPRVAPNSGFEPGPGPFAAPDDREPSAQPPEPRRPSLVEVH
jgi:hypothetical protein